MDPINSLLKPFNIDLKNKVAELVRDKKVDGITALEDYLKAKSKIVQAIH